MQRKVLLLKIHIMKTKAKTVKLTKVSEADLLQTVSEKLKDKVLFKEKTKRAEEYINQVKISAL
jgi:hypothetical protein